MRNWDREPRWVIGRFKPNKFGAPVDGERGGGRFDKGRDKGFDKGSWRAFFRFGAGIGIVNLSKGCGAAEYNSAIQQITNLRYEGTVHGKPSIFLKHASRP